MDGMIMGSVPIVSGSLRLHGYVRAVHPASKLGKCSLISRCPRIGQRRERSQVATPSQDIRPLLNPPETIGTLVTYLVSATDE